MPSCAKCKLIIEDNESYFECDSCKRPIHAQSCSELTSSEIKCMQLKKRVLRFLCNDCNSGLLQIPSIIQSIRELKSEMDILKAAKPIESSETNPVSTAKVSEIIAEMNEREIRKKNIIVFGLPENHNNTQADKDTGIEITKAAYPNTPENIKIFRVGQFNANNTNKTRPMKIILPSPVDAANILRNVKEIKRVQKFENIIVTNDKTPNQTLQYKRLKEELVTRLSKSETNLKIKYFNGEPKIVKNQL